MNAPTRHLTALPSFNSLPIFIQPSTTLIRRSIFGSNNTKVGNLLSSTLHSIAGCLAVPGGLPKLVPKLLPSQGRLFLWKSLNQTCQCAIRISNTLWRRRCHCFLLLLLLSVALFDDGDGASAARRIDESECVGAYDVCPKNVQRTISNYSFYLTNSSTKKLRLSA